MGRCLARRCFGCVFGCVTEFFRESGCSPGVKFRRMRGVGEMTVGMGGVGRSRRDGEGGAWLPGSSRGGRR